MLGLELKIEAMAVALIFSLYRTRYILIATSMPIDKSCSMKAKDQV